MMAVALRSSTLLLTLVVLARGDYDEDFCKNKLSSIQSGTRPWRWTLTLPYNGMLTSEIKTQDTISMVNVHYYSHSFTLIKSVSTTAKGTTFYYTDASFGDQEAFFSNSTCNVEKPTDQNDFRHALRKQDDGTFLIGFANQMVEWYPSSTLQIKNRIFKDYTTYRGIPASHWFTCNYDTLTDKTAVIEWMITDYRNINVVDFATVRLPLFKTSTYSDGTTDAIDYSMVEHIYPINLKKTLERPKNSWCKNENIRKPLPKMPTYIEFTGDVTEIKNGKTNVLQRKKIYDFEKGIFYTYRLDVPEVKDNKENALNISINDLNTAVNFHIQPNAATCATERATSLDVVDIAFSEGSALMPSLQQFLGPNYPAYKYTGERLVRGFECDTWIAKFIWDPWNFTYAWSFMTIAQMETLNYSVNAWRVPVALELYQDDSYTMYSIFSYSTERKEAELRVNADLCFKFQSPTIVRVIVDGRFDDIIQHNGINSFKRAFQTSLQTMGGIGTPMRISDIETYANPNNGNETFAQFRLLPRVLPGEVFEWDRDTLETDDVLKMLRKNVDNGNFLVGVSYPDSNYRQLAVKRGSMEVLDANAALNQGVSSGLTGTNGYAGGSMTGLAFGMIFLGLIIGVGAVYGFKRYRNSIGIDSKFKMSNLQEKADEEKGSEA